MTLILWYIFLLALLSETKTIQKIIKTNYFININYFFISLYFIFAYQTGFDWLNYEAYFNNVGRDIGSKGFDLIFYIFKKMKLDFFQTRIFMMCFLVYFYFKILKYFGKDYFWILFFFMFPLISFNWIEQTKQAFAQVFLFFSFKNYKEKKNFLKILIYYVLSLTFHYVGLIVIPIILIKKMILNKSFVRKTLLLVIILSLPAVKIFFLNIVLENLKNFDLGYVTKQLEIYLIKYMNAISIAGITPRIGLKILEFLVYLFILSYNYKKIKYSFLACIYIISWLMFYQSRSLVRITYIFEVFYYIILIKMIFENALKARIKNNIFFIVMIFYIFSISIEFRYKVYMQAPYYNYIIDYLILNKSNPGRERVEYFWKYRPNKSKEELKLFFKKKFEGEK